MTTSHQILPSAPEGLPHDILINDFYVPGSCTRKEFERYRGKDVFGQILTTSNETLMLYFESVLQDQNPLLSLHLQNQHLDLEVI